MSGVELLTRNVEVSASDATETVAAVEHALASLPGAADGQVTLVLTNDDEITALNREYRSIDTPTDVLSFPMAEDPVLEGEIVVSADTARRGCG